MNEQKIVPEQVYIIYLRTYVAFSDNRISRRSCEMALVTRIIIYIIIINRIIQKYKYFYFILESYVIFQNYKHIYSILELDLVSYQLLSEVELRSNCIILIELNITKCF